MHFFPMRNWCSNSSIFFFLFGLFVAEFCFIGEASAGVLFRNRNQVIRTTMPMVQQNYTVRRSTVALRTTSGSISPRPIGTVDDQAKLISRHYKYQQKLHKWEVKQASVAKKKKEKELKLAEKEQKRRAREMERLRKKQQRDEQQRGKQLAATKGTSSASSVSTPATSPGSRGALSSGSGSSASQASASGSGKGFWRKLLESLFGTKK